MLFGQRCPTCGNSARHARTVKTDDIGITLADDDLVIFDDIALGPVHAIQSFRLEVNFGFCRVLIFGWICASGKNASTEGNGISIVAKNRKHDSSAKRILQTVGFIRKSQAHITQHIGFETLLREITAQSIPFIGGIAQTELASNISRQSPIA